MFRKNQLILREYFITIKIFMFLIGILKDDYQILSIPKDKLGIIPIITSQIKEFHDH